MDLAEITVRIDELVSDWFTARIRAAEAKKIIKLDKGGFSNAATSAHAVMVSLHNALKDSDGIDSHKEAAAIAYAVGQSFHMFVKFAEKTRTKFNTEEYKEDLRQDCARSIFLSLLDVNVNDIAAETRTHETLRALFLLVSTRPFAQDQRMAILIALSTIAFTLERVYPQPPEDELPD